jgi:hypothetical protein
MSYLCKMGSLDLLWGTGFLETLPLFVGAYFMTNNDSLCSSTVYHYLFIY